MEHKLALVAAGLAAQNTTLCLILMESVVCVLAGSAASAANLWLFDSDLLAIKSRQK